ncbi:MAG: hypothetical protein HY001_03915 [Candidatus Portnoybacteria bacterium]|nr:hypothetical protein [Candidatus Portnoybacteria bacterium]
MREKKKKYAIFILGMVGVFVLGLFFFYFRDIPFPLPYPAKESPPLAISETEKFIWDKEREQWDQYIQRVGVLKAYEDMITVYRSKNAQVQHLAAHIFGELLYDKMGIKGISVCDGSFGFGCYHTFFSRALSNHGIEIISALDEACVEKFGPLGLGCPHGIGHGLGEYMGQARLVDQLNVCATLNWQGPVSGCQGGVFMEYNFPILIDGTDIIPTRRPFRADDPYAPCNRVPERFRRACYFEQGEWWARVLAEDYGRIGGLCAGITNRNEYIDCFRGLGSAIGPLSQYNIENSIKSCTLMPSVEEEVLCRAGASWSFFANPIYRDIAPRLCEGLLPDQSALCKRKADLISEMTNPYITR